MVVINSDLISQIGLEPLLNNYNDHFTELEILQITCKT